MRRWVCRIQLLLGFASAVILKSESRGIYDHILLSRIRDSPNLEGTDRVENTAPHCCSVVAVETILRSR
jgi:hypothetical protein